MTRSRRRSGDSLSCRWVTRTSNRGRGQRHTENHGRGPRLILDGENDQHRAVGDRQTRPTSGRRHRAVTEIVKIRTEGPRAHDRPRLARGRRDGARLRQAFRPGRAGLGGTELPTGILGRIDERICRAALIATPRAAYSTRRCHRPLRTRISLRLSLHENPMLRRYGPASAATLLLLRRMRWRGGSGCCRRQPKQSGVSCYSRTTPAWAPASARPALSEIAGSWEEQPRRSRRKSLPLRTSTRRAGDSDSCSLVERQRVGRAQPLLACEQLGDLDLLGGRLFPLPRGVSETIVRVVSAGRLVVS